MMKTILKLEELAIWIACLLLFYGAKVDWWWYLLMFLGPDVSMLGYLVNKKIGAWSYNLFHHRGLAIVVLGVGFYVYSVCFLFEYKWLLLLGIVLLGHSGMDRFFGYGLKYENGFKFTHLGEIGKK